MNITVNKLMDEFIQEKGKTKNGARKSAIEISLHDIAHIMGNKEIIQLLQDNTPVNNKNHNYLDKRGFFATVQNENEQTTNQSCNILKKHP